MKMLIGEQAVDSRDGKSINIFNPATQDMIDAVPSATKEDVEEILERSRCGFDMWSAVPLYKRIDILKNGIAKLREHRDELWKLLQAETGKTVAMATGCFDSSMELADHYIETARILGGDTFPIGNRAGTDGHIIMTLREPLGVVAVVLPFNFPIDAYMHKVVPALLMGNAVIIKPASYTPLTNIRMTELLRESGIPGNVLQLVTGSGAKVGTWLVEDDRVDMVTLTGSTKVGIEIARSSAAYLHRLHLELGGNDPFIILEDADLNEAVEESFVTRLVNAGQRC